MAVYRMRNEAEELWMPGYETNSRTTALGWLQGCEPYMAVVEDRPTSFGFVVARGGDMCKRCGAWLSAHEKTTGGGDCFGCRAADRKRTSTVYVGNARKGVA